MPGDKYFRRKEAAEYLLSEYALQISSQYLAKLAVLGGGPAFYKAGRWPIYERKSLDAWAQGRLGDLVHSTSAYGGAK